MIIVDRNNTCIIVVSFNPPNDFKQNVIRYAEITNNIIIVDNHSSGDILLSIPDNLRNFFTIIKSNENRGIAWGLNRGLSEAFKKGYLYALTLDQDSLPVSNILTLYNTILFKEKDVGLLGTTFTDKIKDFSKVHVKSALTVITSGTLHSLKILPKVGFYNEKLFIDSVDFDFALRVKEKGYRVLRTTEPLLCHHLGSPICKFGIKSSNHNVIRRYYMARNHVIICKLYWKKFPVWIFKKNCFFLITILKMFIVEKNIKEKFIATLEGIYDAFKLNR